MQDEVEAPPPPAVHLCEGDVRALIKYIDDPYERANALSMLQNAGWAGAAELIEELRGADRHGLPQRPRDRDRDRDLVGHR